MSAVLVMQCGGELRPSVTTPNVVFVTIDTLRADRLGAYGYFRDTTPVLDALANESLLFERCLTPMATTFPTHVSLLTSTYPNETGALANTGAGSKIFRPTRDLRSLAQVLQENGYRTAAFVSATPLKKYSGLSAGFDVFDEPEGTERRAEATNAAVLRWLETVEEERFFLWVHYYDPHKPYHAPAPFATKYRPEPSLDRYLTERKFHNGRDDGSVDRVNSRYDGEVSYVDHQLGRLLAELRSRPELWERTILVVLGDHGEGLGQHAEATHGSVWSEQLHAPLIMRIPSMAPARIDRLMSVADVVPTLMGLSELPGEEAFLRQASGVDRLADADSSQTLIFSQESGLRARARGAHQRRYVLTGDVWKLIYDPDAENMRLFQLSSDPFELEDVSDEHVEVAQRLRNILLARLDQQRERERAFGSLSPSVDNEVDPTILEQLRALGYIH